MATMRTYCDGCAAAHALDLVGERWALLVVRELLLGPKRFTDLRAGLPNVSPNVLAQRLRELERAGVVWRRKLPPPAASRVYELTDWGLELEPVITQLGRWGARSPSKPRDAELGVDSLILSFRPMFDARAAEGFTASFAQRVCALAASFTVRIEHPGVFAAGDVRYRSVKRVASAVGEGAIAVQVVCEYPTQRNLGIRK